MFLVGFMLFGVASAVAALADSPAQLVAGRVLLGLGGALVMPSTLSLLRNVFTDPRERTTAIGIWAAVAGVGAAIGPVLGGYLVEHFGWSAAFWVNVPVVVATVAAGIFILPESRSPGHGPLDWFGALLSTVGVITLAWGIKHLAGEGLTAAGGAAVPVGVIVLYFFVRRQLSQPDPLLDVRLFGNRAFLAGAVATFSAMMSIGAALYLLSLWLQYVQGYSPLRAGLHMLPAAAALLLASLSTSRLMHWLGIRAVIGIGLGTLAVGFAVLAFAPMNYLTVAVALVAFGVGDGMALTATASVMVSAAPPERAGGAAAVEEACYELGIGFGVALFGSGAAVAYRIGLDGLPISGADRAAVQESIGDATAIATKLGGDLGAEVFAVARSAFGAAVQNTAAVSAIVVVLIIGLALWLIPRGFGPTPSTECKKTAAPLKRGARRLSVKYRVEVPGIEPGSFVASSGLLRAQLTMPLLGPTDHVSELV